MAFTATPQLILFGDLPLLVAGEFARLAATAPDLRLSGPVAGGAELVAQAQTLRPAVIVAPTAQFAALSQLSRPVRVLRYAPADAGSLSPTEGDNWTLNGAIAPLPPLLAERAAWRRQVLQQLRLAASPCTAFARLLDRRPPLLPPTGLVVIGASTGGPAAVEALLSQLTSDLRCAVLVAVHLPSSFTASLVARLRRASVLPVRAATGGSQLLAGQVLVVPGGTHMLVRRAAAGHWTTCTAPETGPAGGDVPSIDLLLTTAAAAVGRRVLGVVLTGLGHDGTRGARAVREHGGQVLVQDVASAAVFSMPGAVLRAGWASAALPLAGLAAAVNAFGAAGVGREATAVAAGQVLLPVARPLPKPAKPTPL